MWHTKDNATGNGAGRGGRRALRFACLAVLLTGSFAAAQSASNPAKPHRPHAAHPAVNTPPVTATPAPQVPETPKWPANEAPKQPSITWNSEGLRIQASNANLSQILNQISTRTGAKVEGLSKDERVFGDYGPGQAKDVLAQLLHGSGYDYLMLGDEGQGTPRTIILSARRNAPPPSQNSVANDQPDQQPDEDTVVEPDNDEPDQQPPQVFQPPQPPQQPENPQGPMTPQQRMQLMQQQRLQQMQQMQRQYQQQQEQQPQ